MSQKYVLLILSPFQFINALEYLHKKQIRYNNCNVVLLSERKIAVNQILNEFEEIKHFENVYIPMIGKRNYLIRFLKTKKLLQQFNRCIPIVGNLDNHWAKFVIKSSLKDIMPVVVDDGAAAIDILKLRNKNEYRTSHSKILSQKGLLEYLFLKSRKPLPVSIRFFSCFNISPSLTDELLINDFEYIKRKYQDNHSNLIDEIWVLGTPLLEKQFIIKEADDIIFDAFKVFGETRGFKVKYFVHRIEKLENNYGFEIIKNTIPFEIFYLRAKERPKYVMSYYSTSLYVLHRMKFKTKFVSIKINQNWRGKANWNRIEEVYDFYKLNGVEVININDLPYI
ncbi:hypothetical protein [Winogradskyella sp.]|uniref:hypothetical protein n=1 Tax=Winogradskyella sp. TaxID=1883156 RepID=UPI00261359B3|nr:hypothetical protein [Winogradskyella sp.]